jgi:hypothetical protein
VGRRRFLLVANVVVLIVCATLLAAPSAGAATSLGPGFDPSARGGVLARARMSSGVSNILLQPSGESAVTIPSGSAPSVDGDLVAYADSQGVKVVNWRTGARVTQIDGAVAKPALDWPLLAFVRTGSTYKRLIVADYTDPAAPTERWIARAEVMNDLGRPSLVAGRIAWHKLTPDGARIYVQRLATGKRTVVARSDISVLANPSLSSTRVVWMAQSARACSLQTRRFDRRTVKRIYRTTSATRLLWTTALTGRTVYVTQWSSKTGSSTLVRVNF